MSGRVCADLKGNGWILFKNQPEASSVQSVLTQGDEQVEPPALTERRGQGKVSLLAVPVKRRPRGPRAKAVAASASGRHQPALETPPGSRETRGPPRSCSRTDGQVPEPLTSRGGDSGAVSRGSRSTRRPLQPLGTRGETPGLAALPGFHAEERHSPEEPVLPSGPGGPAALRGKGRVPFSTAAS